MKRTESMRLVASLSIAAVYVIVFVATPTASGSDRDGTSAAVSKERAAKPAAEDAQALVTQGKLAVRDARATDDVERKSRLQKQARGSFGMAREIYEADRDRFKAEYDRFDKFIPKTDRARYEAREAAFSQYVQAQLHLGVLLYEEAQSWDKGSPENRQLLTDGTNAFEMIHARYRQMLAGLYARMWQGKCFEERGDIAKALGIYNELLEHEPQNPNDALAKLQDRVRLFRLNCLREHRKDFALVIEEAHDWLDRNPDKASTPVGLGVQWELACAAALLAESERTLPAERNRLLRQALVAAKAIRAHPGEYKASSQALIERLTPKLKLDPDDLR